MKTRIQKIEILWSENTWFQDCFCQPHNKHRPRPTFALMADANNFLFRMATHFGSDRLGYDKTDFRITWEDGETYEGRYDLHGAGDHQENPNGCCDLADHVRAFVMFLAGERKPARYTPEQYETVLRRHEMTPEKRKEAKEWLEKYEL